MRTNTLTQRWTRFINGALFERGNRMGKRELLTVGLVAVGLAAALNAPLLPRMTTSFPEVGFGDPYLTAWMVAWDGHALLAQPTDFFDSNTFWPLEDSLAFSDALLGYTPAGLFGEGLTAAIVRHNLLYLFAQAFAFFGAYVLARELGVSPAGAFLAGVAFAYAPWRLDQRTHLHVLSSGGIPMTLFLLTRGYRQRKPWWIVGGTLVAIWQISLGFTHGIPLGYLLAVLAVVALVFHRRRGQQPLGRGIVVATVCGCIALAGWTALQATPYFRVVDEHPEARRTTKDVRFYSPPLKGLVTAPPDSFMWGDLTQPLRQPMRWPSEQAIFPGYCVVAMTILGLASDAARRLRVGIGLGTIACFILALGFGFPGGSVIYGLLHDIAPGWQAIRVPGRLMTFASLGLCLLAAFGVDLVSTLWRRSAKVLTALAVVPLLVLLEGVGDVRLTDVPVPPAELTNIAGPRLHLPANDITDRVYMLWSVDGFPAIANGESGFLPQSSESLRELMRTFPDPSSVALLRERGIETVMFHPGLVDDEIKEFESYKMENAPASEFGITREIGEDYILFRLTDR